MRTLVAEGWRFIAHSYALVHQYQLLEFLNRDGVRVFHKDLPYADGRWRPSPAPWSAEQNSRLDAVQMPPETIRADAVLRIGFPHFFHADPTAEQTFVFGTAEARRVDDSAIGIGRPAREVLAACEAKIITPSNWSADGFVKSGAYPDKVYVVPHGVDPFVFRPVDLETRACLRKRLGWEGRFVIINVSAMTGNKGIGLILKSAALLAQRFRHIKVVLKGADDLYPSSKNAYGALLALGPHEAGILRSRIAYVGDTLPAEELATYYQAADLYVSPYSAEAFNLPVLEAAACGLPVVCTRGGPTDDFVNDDFALRIESKIASFRNGAEYLQPAFEHLVELIRRAIEDDSVRSRAASAGPAWVNERFTWRRVVDQLVGVLFGEDPNGGGWRSANDDQAAAIARP